MILKLSRWPLLALSGGVFMAGCGNGSESTTSSQTTPSAAATTPATTSTQAKTTPPATSSASAPPAPTTTAPATPATPKTIPAPAAPAQKPVVLGKQAAELCKQAIKAQPSLGAGPKAKLEKTCGKASGGGQAALREVAREVCEEIITSSHVPAGTARQQALAVCGKE